MKRNSFGRSIASVIVLVLFIIAAVGSSSTFINDEDAVLKDMQGAWVGYDHEGGIYTHYKLVISNKTFEGWMQTANTSSEPSWSSNPDETGTFKLSPVQGYTNTSGNYRNIKKHYQYEKKKFTHYPLLILNLL